MNGFRETLSASSVMLRRFKNRFINIFRVIKAQQLLTSRVKRRGP